MTTTLFYQPTKNWRFGVALGAAVLIHLAAIGFASVRQVDVKLAGVSGEPPEIILEPMQPNIEPQPELSEPVPTPPVVEQSFPEEMATPPPIHRFTARTATTAGPARSGRRA